MAPAIEPTVDHQHASQNPNNSVATIAMAERGTNRRLARMCAITNAAGTSTPNRSMNALIARALEVVSRPATAAIPTTSRHRRATRSHGGGRYMTVLLHARQHPGEPAGHTPGLHGARDGPALARIAHVPIIGHQSVPSHGIKVRHRCPDMSRSPHAPSCSSRPPPAP